MMYSLLLDKLYAAGQMRIPEKINKRSFYKFLHETGGHAVLKSCLEGNIMFSRIPELNDFSETFAVADKKDIAKSLSEMQKKGLRKDELVSVWQRHSKISQCGLIMPITQGVLLLSIKI